MVNWIDAKKEIDEEIELIRFNEPDEIKKIFQYGIIESGAGSYSQYFTTMVFVEGDCRALAFYNINNLLFIADDPSFTLEHLKTLAKIYLPLSSEFLGYCGLKKLWEFVKKTLEALDTVKTKDEFKELMSSLNLYVAILHGWIHHRFPWYIGVLFPQKKREEIIKMLKITRLKTD